MTTRNANTAPIAVCCRCHGRAPSSPMARGSRLCDPGASWPAPIRDGGWQVSEDSGWRDRQRVLVVNGCWSCRHPAAAPSGRRPDAPWADELAAPRIVLGRWTGMRCGDWLCWIAKRAACPVGAQPPPRVLGQQPLDHRTQGAGAHQRRRRVGDHRGKGGNRAALPKRRSPLNRRIQRSAQREQVRRRAPTGPRPSARATCPPDSPRAHRRGCRGHRRWLRRCRSR